MKPSQKIAAKIKEFRKKADISQQELSIESGVPHRTLQDIEAGKTNPNLETLTMLDKAGVPVAELFSKTLSFSDAQRLLDAYSDAPAEVRDAVKSLLAVNSSDIAEAQSQVETIQPKPKPKAP